MKLSSIEHSIYNGEVNKLEGLCRFSGFLKGGPRSLNFMGEPMEIRDVSGKECLHFFAICICGPVHVSGCFQSEFPVLK